MESMRTGEAGPPGSGRAAIGGALLRPLPLVVFVPALVVILLAAALLYRAWWPTGGDFAAATIQCPLLFCDFEVVYYPMGEAVLQTHEPVDGYFYTPTFALLLSPLGALQIGPAKAAWAAVLALSGLSLLLLPLLLFDEGRSGLGLVYATLLTTAQPLLAEFAWGQVGTMCIALVVLSFVADRRDRPGLSGLLLAMAIAVKFYAGIFGLYFLLRGNRRAVASCVAWSAVLLLAVPAAALGWTDTAAFYGEVFSRLRLDGPSNTITSQFGPRVVARWLTAFAQPGSLLELRPADGMESELSDWDGDVASLTRVVIGVVLIANLAASILFARRLGSRAVLPVFVLIACSIPLFLRPSWEHYFTFLPLCQVVVLQIWSARGRLGAAGAVAAILVLASVGLSSVFLFRALGSWQAMGFFGCLFFADLAVLLSLYTLLPGLVREATPATGRGSRPPALPGLR